MGINYLQKFDLIWSKDNPFLSILPFEQPIAFELNVVGGGQGGEVHALGDADRPLGPFFK